jgi:hypothetical protein
VFSMGRKCGHGAGDGEILDKPFENASEPAPSFFQLIALPLGSQKPPGNPTLTTATKQQPPQCSPTLSGSPILAHALRFPRKHGPRRSPTTIPPAAAPRLVIDYIDFTFNFPEILEGTSSLLHAWYQAHYKPCNDAGGRDKNYS